MLTRSTHLSVGLSFKAKVLIFVKFTLSEIRAIVRSALVERRHFDVDEKHMSNPKFVWMPIHKITQNTEVWSDDKLNAVRADVHKSNKISPLRLVRDENGNIHVGDGIHRLNVAKELGHTHVPAIWDDYYELDSNYDRYLST